MLLAEAGTDSTTPLFVLPQASAKQEVQFVADRDVALSYVDPVEAAADVVVAAAVVDSLDGTFQGGCLLAPEAERPMHSDVTRLVVKAAVPIPEEVAALVVRVAVAAAAAAVMSLPDEQSH